MQHGWRRYIAFNATHPVVTSGPPPPAWRDGPKGFREGPTGASRYGSPRCRRPCSDAATRSSPAVAHHRRQRLLVREHADALGQVLVALRILGDPGAQPRQHLEGPGVVERRQRRDLDPAELQAVEAPAGPQHPPRLAQHRRLVGAIAQAEGDGDLLHAAIRQRDMLRIGADEGEAGRQAALQRPPLRHLQHGGVDVRQDGPPRPCLQCAEGDIAGPARQIEQRLPRGGPDRGDEGRFPGPVQAERHEVVHQVVARRHAVENLPHHAGLLGAGHGAVAEVDGFG